MLFRMQRLCITITAAFVAYLETSPNMNDLVRHYLKVPDGSGLRFHVEQRLYFYGKLEDTIIVYSFILPIH